ncbi:rhodanese-like domain-containing protein [Nocardiopsis sp. NPDC050513]|uniref:rhodanese-like domain-containing protein n=1 Tax=Nocardiopsis sp. NPDC050513 TaxID=3364338 RepID=UPI0037A912E5
MTDPSIDVASARALLDAGPDTVLLDVRTPAEYGTAHIAGSVNLPLGLVRRHLERVTSTVGERLILVCQSGARAEECRAVLADAGLTGTAVLRGGMAAWSAAGAPVVRGRQRWALERQVRLVAGSTVLASAIASLWWTPAVWIAALVGAGLTFAAVSDTCVMGMLLTKLPHNQPHEAIDVEESLARIARVGGTTAETV